MRKFFTVLTILILLLPSHFSYAQDDDFVPEPAGDEGSVDEIQTESDIIDIVPSKEIQTEPDTINVIPPESKEAEHTVFEDLGELIASGGSAVAGLGERFIRIAPRIGFSILIIAGQILLLWLIWRIFKKINIRIAETGTEKIKPLTIRKFKVLTSRQIIKVIQFLLRILKYVISAVQLFLTVPIIFSLFPATRNIATTLFGYILSPIRKIGYDAYKFLPNLFTIALTVIATHYILRILKYFSTQIEKGKLVFPKFYPDWAAPTYKILQILLWAFTIAIIYPYLPGSDSRAFQGVSVFVGVIFSLGSSSAIGNLVAGFVITYMRPFKLGDRVQIKEVTGFVVEKNLMVVRLKTHKNEYVTFPNIMILGSNIINYNTSSDEDEEGLIIYTEITMGYSTPWQTVHDILVDAALATDHVLKRPKPFVLQTMLDDFYARYQINCYTKEIGRIPAIYTALYENIQNGFLEAGIDMTTAHYRAVIKKNEAK